MLLVYCGETDLVVLEATRPSYNINRPELVNIIISWRIDVKFQGWKTSREVCTGKMRSSHCHVTTPTGLGHDAVQHLLRIAWFQNSYFSFANCEFMLVPLLTGQGLNWWRNHSAWVVLYTAHICFGCQSYHALISPLVILRLLLSPHSNQSSTEWSLLFFIFILN